MANEKFYARVGFFVAGAFILGFIGIVFIYDRYLHERVETYVMFFKGSLAGLEQNSPVTYRGVKIGEVRLVEVTENKTRTNVNIPVYVEFFVDKTFGKYGNPIRLLVQNGVVANITSPNILTGTASIELIQGEAKRVTKASYYNGYAIFPTKKSELGGSNYNQALQSARQAFEDLSAFLKSKELHSTITAIRDMSKSLTTLSANFNQQMPVSLAYFNNGFKQFSQTAYSAEILMDSLYRHPESLLRGK